MGTEDDNQNSILKGILQNGSSFNYPGVCSYANFKLSLSGKSQECDPLHTSHYNCLQVEKITSLTLLQVNSTAEGKAN